MYDGGNFTPILRQVLRGQNTSVEIGLIELTEPFDTLNYKPFFKHYIFQLFYTYFYCFYFCGTKSFFVKTRL